MEITIAKEFLGTVNFRHTGQEYIYLPKPPQETEEFSGHKSGKHGRMYPERKKQSYKAVLYSAIWDLILGDIGGYWGILEYRRTIHLSDLISLCAYEMDGVNHVAGD